MRRQWRRQWQRLCIAAWYKSYTLPAMGITIPFELRTISLPPPPSLPITRHHLHSAHLSVTPGPSVQNKNVVSSNTPTLTHLIIHPPHLNDTHHNSYSFPSWPSELLLTTLWKNLWFVAALVNKLVPRCAWLLSSALEVLRLSLRLRITV